MGIGDALYVQAVARHLVKKGQRLKVCTAWPDVFRPLNGSIETAPFTRAGIDILAHYSARKPRPDTDQFEDVCQTAGIREPVEFKIDWQITDEALVERLRRRASGRRIILVQLPRVPMGRTDGFGKELLPDCTVIQRAIDLIGNRAMVVQIGSGKALHRFDGIEVDLANETTVCQLIDVASVADGFLGYVSFIVPLAESLGKPALLVWSRRGLNCGTPYVRQITPKKVLHCESSRHVVDDCTSRELSEAVEVLLRS